MTARRPSPTAKKGDALRVISYNVNGLRACARKGFGRWLTNSGAWLIGLQEVRALEKELPEDLMRQVDRNYHSYFSPAERRGYSGVGLFCRSQAKRVDVSLGEARFDIEGRVQIARLGRLAIANVYFPKGSGNARDNSRVPYKLDFYRALFDQLEPLRRGGYRVLVMGDFNTAHREIDLARPRDNRKSSGFLPEERAELDRWIDAGYVDTLRAFEAAAGIYSWWSQRGGARERNVGWRIDYVFASKAAMKYVRGAFVQRQVKLSDHCPVGVDLDPAILS